MFRWKKDKEDARNTAMQSGNANELANSKSPLHTRSFVRDEDGNTGLCHRMLE